MLLSSLAARKRKIRRHIVVQNVGKKNGGRVAVVCILWKFNNGRACKRSAEVVYFCAVFFVNENRHGFSRNFIRRAVRNREFRVGKRGFVNICPTAVVKADVFPSVRIF